MFSPPSLFVCLSVNSLKKELAEAGRQTVLGPEISRLDFTDDPDLGFPPSGTIMSLKDLCVPLGMLVQYSACPNQQLNNISPYVCVREGSCSCECTVHHFKRVRADSEVRRLSTDVCVFVSNTNLVQDLSVASQELRQVFDQLFNTLQAPVLHNGSGLFSNGLWD